MNGAACVCPADDFLILVKSAKAAQRVMESVATYVEGKLKLVVNRTKSRCAPLAECEFLGFKISKQGKDRAPMPQQPLAEGTRGS